MLQRGMLVCGMIAAIALGAATGWAQQTKKSDAADADGPNLVPVKTDKPGTGVAAPVPKDTPPAKASADANTAGAKAKSPTTAKGQDSGFGNMWFYVVLLGGFVLLYFWMGRSRRKQESRRKEMLANLKKNDKIVTIGGVIGTVIEARPEEITVKVDETNNVRMKFARWAIRGVGEEAKDTPEDKK